MNEKTHGLAYCPHCGSVTGDFFVIGEMVLVDSGTERPYYAKIKEIRQGDDGPYAVVLKSPTEFAKPLLAHIKKVEDQN